MDSDLHTLQHWAQFGGTWRVVESSADAATISLSRCDGGEEVQRLVTHDRELLAWSDRHPDSESA